MRFALLIAVGFACAAAVARSADAHIGVTPGFLTADDTQTLNLSVHNDADRPMTGLAVRAPSGLRIVAAGAEGEWQGAVGNGTATWTGGPLAPNTGGTFELDVEVEAAAKPGSVELEAEQLYSDGGSLRWPIAMTVLPPSSVTGQASVDDPNIGFLVLIGVLTTATVFVFAWLRRRGRSLQEK